MVKRIYVCKGRYALIDDEDAELISKADWYPAYSHKTMYARTGSRLFGKTQHPMHRLVMRALPGQIVDHINGDGLDNRRQNLRFVTAEENRHNWFEGDRFDAHNDKAIKLVETPFQKVEPLLKQWSLRMSPRLRRMRRVRRKATTQ